MPPDHLITAGLMSAPASLAIAKTLFPETRKTKADWEAIRNVKTKYFFLKAKIKIFLNT